MQCADLKPHFAALACVPFLSIHFRCFSRELGVHNPAQCAGNQSMEHPLAFWVLSYTNCWCELELKLHPNLALQGVWIQEYVFRVLKKKEKIKNKNCVDDSFRIKQEKEFKRKCVPWPLHKQLHVGIVVLQMWNRFCRILQIMVD